MISQETKKNNQRRITMDYTVRNDKEKREVERIKAQYEPRKTSKLDELKSLNNSVNNPPVIISLIIGIISTLIFGYGLTLILVWDMLYYGIAVMLFALPFMLIAYPIYRIILKAKKKKYGADIINLSNELLNSEAE